MDITKTPCVEILADHEVLHPADAQGARITRWQVIRVKSTYNLAEVWTYPQTGAFVRCDSTEIPESVALDLVEFANAAVAS